MSMQILLSSITVGLLGVALSWFILSFKRRYILRQAESQASEWIETAEEKAKALEEEAKARAEEYVEEFRSRFEKDVSPLLEKIETIKNRVETREEDLEEQYRSQQSQFSKRENVVKSHVARTAEMDKTFRDKLSTLNEVKQNYVARLAESSKENLGEVKARLAETIENEVKANITRDLQVATETFEQDAEKNAERVIANVIGRFARPYCPERGIGNVDLINRDIMLRTLGPERGFLREIEKLCGVDIHVHEEVFYASVLGFDPVRRELGRASLERLVADRHPELNKISRMVASVKTELFKKIRNDGLKVAAELGAQNLHDEIKNMMGALRYRYSFAQNQHFHCAEVGWLCGLLSAELGLSVKDGKRAGLLHDIGKAMDHSIDGGHAVIGADFIQKHGEADPIVHAVRAHHHDEPPSTDLAYLVIAADAISGARPGARRSTMDSYNQKMADLEKIGNSFPGVLSTYILSAGREVRVIVDAHQVNDHEALRLSQQIAKRIEEELSYPGLIKVTVVRETQAVQYAK